MSKTYYLYLDESGDFDSDLSKEYRNKCLIGGILYEAGKKTQRIGKFKIWIHY